MKVQVKTKNDIVPTILLHGHELAVLLTGHEIVMTFDERAQAVEEYDRLSRDILERRNHGKNPGRTTVGGLI